MKFIITYNKDLKKYRVEKVSIIEEEEKQYTIEVDNCLIKRHKNHVYEDMDVAILVAKEMNIKRKMKNEELARIKKDKKDYYECPICHKHIDINRDDIFEQMTIDHKLPRSYFKNENGGEDIRLNKILHSKMWNKDNLRIICKKCNKKKGDDNRLVGVIRDRRLWGKSNSIQKVSYGLGKKCDFNDDLIMELARKDSRTYNARDIIRPRVKDRRII